MNPTTTLHITKPAVRNPFARLARQRQAGRHGCGPSAQRQHAERALRRELDRERHPIP